MKKLLVALVLALGCMAQPTQLVVEAPGASAAPSPDAYVDGGVPAGIPVIYLNGQHIAVRDFWGAPGWSLGEGMRWEMIAEGDPWNPSGYPEPDGYGGEHAILFSGSSGNIIFDQGTPQEQIITFGSLDTPPNGIMSHVQVVIQPDPYGEKSIVVRENGIPCGRTFIPHGAQRTTAGAGSGTLFWGGSDHSFFTGSIAAARGWDTVAATDVRPNQAMIPPRWFDGVGPNGEPVDFLMSFVSPYLITYPDLSGGYDSNGEFPRRMPHPGIPSSGLDYADVWWNPPVAPTALPKIKYVTNAPFDPKYDETASAQVTALKRGCTKTAPPAGAKLFDSFCRQDREFFHHQHPDVGSLEVDTIGTNPRWQTGSNTGYAPAVPAAGTGEKYAVGIYNRSPVPLDYMSTDMWVPNDSGDATVTVTRRPQLNTSSDGNVGIAFRVQDESHLWFCAFQNEQAGDGTIVDRHFYLMRSDGYGYPALILAADMTPALENFAQLTVSAHGSSITCSADGVPVISTTDSTYATATGFGMHMTSALSRMYNWTLSN